jgi:hypothetical protein
MQPIDCAGSCRIAVAPGQACAMTIALLAAGLLIAGCHEPVPFSAQVAEWKEAPNFGKQITTDHFHIYSTVPVDHPSNELAITYLFQTRNQWERFTRQFAGPLAVNYLRIQHGGFTQGNIAVVHCIANSDRFATLAVMAHEGMHQYLQMNVPAPVPPWLNEGLACYCEGHDWRGEHPIFTPKWNVLRLEHLREAIGSDSFIPLPVILDSQAGSMIQLASRQVRTYYAEVWSMIVFLRHGGGPYQHGFEVLLSQLGSEPYRRRADAQMTSRPGMSFGEAIFRSYITEDFEGFMLAYKKYARQLAESDSLASSHFRQAHPLLDTVGESDSRSL